MQHNFLAAYELAKQQTTPVTGLWLLHGDETLLAQWLIERLQPQWQAQQLAIQRFEITAAKIWPEILAALNGLSLFDDSKVIIAQGNHKPDKDSLAELQAFASDASQNCLIVISDKYDKKSQQSAFFQLCVTQGQVIDCQLTQPQQREQLHSQQAQQFGLNLTKEAWQLLLAQTQHNLLTAYQSLWRLSYLYAPAYDTSQPLITIDETQLRDGLVSQSRYTTFDLSDAMLQGNIAQVVTIFQQLRRAEEPESLILWVIAKDMRSIQSLLAGASFQSLGIWSNKQGLYNQALRRHSLASTQDWANRLYSCDQAIKGLVAQPAWELLLQAALLVAGTRLLH